MECILYSIPLVCVCDITSKQFKLRKISRKNNEWKYLLITFTTTKVVANILNGPLIENDNLDCVYVDVQKAQGTRHKS